MVSHLSNIVIYLVLIFLGIKLGELVNYLSRYVTKRRINVEIECVVEKSKAINLIFTVFYLFIFSFYFFIFIFLILTNSLLTRAV